MDLGTALGLAIGVLGILISLIIARRGRRFRRLDGWTLSDSSILGTQHVPKLAVVYEDIPLDQPRLIIVEIVNAGALEIETNRFEKPITFTVPEDSNTTIVSATVASASKDIEPSVELHGDPGHAKSAEIKRLLINRSERFTVQLLVDGPEPVQFHSRIAGGSLRNLGQKTPDARSASRTVRVSLATKVAAAVAAICALVATFSIQIASSSAKEAENLDSQLFRAEEITSRIPAPNVVGMSLVDAATLLHSLGMHYTAVEAPSHQPPRTVLSQDPEPGESSSMVDIRLVIATS